MTIEEQLLAALATYGVLALFGSVLVAALGAPLPASFLLVVGGSLIEQGDMSFWPAVLASITGAVLGDQLGYLVGRFGGRALAERISRWAHAERQLAQAEALATRWGGPGIFLSRWLFTAAGPWFNVISGIAGYPVARFSGWVVAGESLWVILYVGLGLAFSTQLDAVVSALGDLSWAGLGILLVIVLSYLLVQTFRRKRA